MKVINFTTEPSFNDRTKLAHFHVNGVCRKNRYGVRCG